MLHRSRLLIVLTAAGLLASATPAAAAPAGQVTRDDIALTVAADGTMKATETVTYTGDAPHRTFINRKHLDDTKDRRYVIEGVEGGTVREDGDHTIVTLNGSGSGKQTAKLSYTVKGAISPSTGRQELNWTATGGWNVPVGTAKVTVDSPAAVQNLNCFAGELSSTVGCTQFFTNHTHTQAIFQQRDLQPGEYLTVVVGYPAQMTTGKQLTAHRHTLATAFDVNLVTGGTLVALLVLLLGGIALLYSTRGRDSRTVSKKAAEGDHPPVGADAAFAPPDGVRPGQIGTLIDEQADVIDVTATIVDLAVRGYLLVEELPTDWRLRRLDRPATDLLPYERTLYDALFTGRDAVRLSELGGTFSGQLAAVRGALYDDVVRQGWFARRPDSERTRWTTIGMILAGAGVIGTVLLALYTEFALIGLAVIIAGAALAFGGQYMPAKTSRGATVLAHTIGFREHLYRGEIPDTPAHQRVALFSRYLPYAVVFDTVPRWAATVADVGPGQNGQADNLYWYEGPAEWDLSNFAESMRTFTLATSGAISASRQFRGM